MSLPFSNTTNNSGLIQLLEENLGYEYGDISGNAVLLKKFTAALNRALDRAVSLIIQSCGEWDWDDSNQTDWPIITTGLVSGKRDYPFTTDEVGNLILEVKRVLVADRTGVFKEIYPVDQSVPTAGKGSAIDTGTFLDGRNQAGIPQRYDKTGNGIFLDPVPDYAITPGLKMVVDREASYFTTSDTSKKPGFAGLYHEYLATWVTWVELKRRRDPSANEWKKDVLSAERDLKDYYATRDRDVQRRMTANVESSE